MEKLTPQNYYRVKAEFTKRRQGEKYTKCIVCRKRFPVSCRKMTCSEKCNKERMAIFNEAYKLKVEKSKPQAKQIFELNMKTWKWTKKPA